MLCSAVVALSVGAMPARAGIDATARGLALSRANAGQLTASQAVNVYGDSLTAGNQDGSGVTLPSALSVQLGGRLVRNFGIGGQVSTHIAMRQGGASIALTLSGDSIPSSASGNPATVTAINGVAVAGMSTAQAPDYRLLSTIADNNGRQISGTLCGVHGRLQRYNLGISGGPPSTTEAYRFYPDAWPTTSGAAVTCTGGSAFTLDNATFFYQPSIFWAGRNNYSDTAQVESDIAAMWATCAGAANPSCLILGVINGEYSGEVQGQTGYNQIVAINANSASLHPGHFWDVRSWLVSQYDNTNIMDQQDHTNDVVPYSKRAVIASGTISGALGTTGCPTLSGAASTGTLKIDSEYIFANSVSGSVVSTCTRGQGTGGAAASHSSGAAYTIVDNIHLSGATDSAIAAYIATNYGPMLSIASSAAASPQALASVLASPTLGTASQPATVTKQLNVGSTLQFLGGGTINGLDSGANPVGLIRNVSGGVFVGGGFVSTVCLGTGGTGGNCAQTSANNGDWIMTKGATLGSATDATVAAGELALTKAAASGSAPGAAYLKLGTVCGTNAGTAKIIAYAGTSTTPTTLLDNVGSGVTGC